MKQQYTKKVWMMVFGILLLGFAISLFRLSGFGTDPFIMNAVILLIAVIVSCIGVSF